MKDDNNGNGKRYWRSFNQLADSPDFRKFVENEFPEEAAGLKDSVSRRRFLTLMGASLSLAGLAGCRRPTEKIIPYVIQPEEVVPGIPQFYATTMPFGTSAYGLIVESHEGRPTKIEGNPDHPSTKGASNSFIQSEILTLYDPDRSQRYVKNGATSDKNAFKLDWRELYTKFTETQGNGLAVLAEPFSSPTLFRFREEFRRKFPRARWVTYEPSSDENIFNGIEVATGNKHLPRYNFENSKRIVSIDADFLHIDRDSIANTAGFSKMRKVDSENDEMNRLYVIESGYSVTGSMADHRLRLQSRQIGAFTAALVLELQRQGLTIPGINNVDFGGASAISSDWIQAAAHDLMEHRGESVVLTGRSQPPGVHALACAINTALRNNGSTVDYFPPVDKLLPDSEQLSGLAEDLRDGQVDTLIVFGGNPVYDTPADLGLSDNINKAKNVIHFGLYNDETGIKANWHIPRAHFLESWGDARSADGMMSVTQPMIAPLYDGMMEAEFYSLLTTGSDRRGYDIVRDTWRMHLRRDFESRWRKVLHDGISENSGLQKSSISINSGSLSRYLNANKFSTDTANANELEIVFTPSKTVFDGRYANNGWLQELPDPITKLTWDNAAVMSPKTAEELGVKNFDLVLLTFEGRTLKMPVWVVPGYADFSVAVALGYGRTVSGKIGNNKGFNAFSIRTTDTMNFGKGLKIELTGETYTLANVQDHGSLEGRPHILEATLDEYKHDPEMDHIKPHTPELRSMWKEHSYDEGYQWGMAIDLNTCIGCNACTTACQSENNIPVVGKDRVIDGREMHWIRIDRYFVSGDDNMDDPEIVYQPMGCQHCELAPCEQVCPVAATVHDKEGLNTMVYNRCIGTRYCSNNCPYKVRRFNFFNYTNNTPEVQKMANNPDVTVRSRGVMEKCTYCVQRLTRAKSQANLAGEEVKDGGVRTACQQACPASAIVFGNVNDPESEVSKVKQQNRNYAVLAELNIKPRTTYLAKLRNPNPELE
ncbi:TAT-variant-translocated molybdopterin oxidoreductase [candidate division KSB1 bacterium]